MTVILKESYSKITPCIDKIHDIAISFDGKFFASASQDTTIKVFDFETKQLVHKFVDSDNRKFS